MNTDADAEARAVLRILDRPELLDALLPDALRGRMVFGPVEFSPRASGLKRAGVVAVLVRPETGGRLGVGIDTPLAHAIVDHLLGDARSSAESRLQVTPVEWGVLTHLALRAVKRLDEAGVGGFVLDRVGPDPLDTAGLGAVVGVVRRATLGEVAGAVRLWLPAAMLGESPEPAPRPPSPEPLPSPFEFAPDELVGPWTAVAGTMPLPRGKSSLRVGRVLPMDVAPTPWRPVRLVLAGDEAPFEFEAELDPDSDGGRVRVRSGLRPASGGTEAEAATVELGWVYLTGAEIAALRPGEPLTLERDEDAPVALTVGGRIVARGELIRIEEDLGVRLTEVQTG